MSELQLQHRDDKKQTLGWYVLVSYYEGMPEKIYSKIKSHTIEPLYWNTQLNDLIKFSPLIIQLKDNTDELLRSISAQHSLYFADNQKKSLEQITTWFRTRLNILIDNKKGIFHYYHPIVASYFFSESSIKDTADWLAPFWGIQYLEQQVGKTSKWVFRHGKNNVTEKSQPWKMRESQIKSLIQKYRDETGTQ
ncbi:DUF4123 domain-containing protein [Celerinatantimonas yamalensis]|uniref:DUF4123 domain-containing protein n=1 Tax=Celerinatantimonas yamalensis TaxID=559956 RepID=A0ABW9GAN4_9GAMM